MKKDIVDIVLEKEYVDLTVDERAELSEFCDSEAEFLQLKNVFKSVENMPVEELTPRAETKERLDQLFDQTYPKAPTIWYNSILSIVVPKDKPIYRQPLVQIAAVALLALLTIPLFNSNLNEENTQVASNEIVEEDKLSENDNVSNTEVNPNATTEPIGTEGTASRSETIVDDSENEQALSNEESFGRMDETVLGGSMEPMSSSHPDGVFEGTVTVNVEVAYSMPASESEDLLDLLTTSF